MTTTQAPPRSRTNRLRVALCDTDFLMNQTAEAVRSATAGFLGMGVRAYAAQHVFDELYRDDGHGHPTKWHKLSEQARESGKYITVQDFRDVFEEELLPKVTFVRMGALCSDHPLVMLVRTARGGRGASDAPTAQLAVLLSRLRPVTYSHDQHLYKPGVAPRPAGLAAASLAEQQVARAEYMEIGAAGLIVGSVAGADYLARTAARWAGSSAWLGRAAAIGFGVWALSSPTRRAKAGQVAGAMAEVFAGQLAQADQAMEILDGVAAAVAPLDTIECRIAELLVTRSEEDRKSTRRNCL